MSRDKATIISTILIGFLVLISIFLSGCVEEEKELTIKIGVILPQTGALSSIGNEMVNSAQLAVEHINQEGGIIDGKTVELIIEDSQTTPDQATLAAQRLKDKDVQVIVGAAANDCTLAVATETKSNNIVILSPASTTPELTDNDWIFRVVGDDTLQGNVMVDLTKTLGITHIAIVSMNNAYGTGIHDVIKEKAGTSGLTIVQESLYDENMESYESELITIKSAIEDIGGNTTGIVFTGYGEQARKMFQNAHTLEMTTAQGYQWIANEGVVDASELLENPIAGEAANGTYGVTAAIPESEMESDFKTTYSEHYGNDPISYCYYTYDAVQVAAAAIDNAGSNNGTKIRDELFKIKDEKAYSGISGEKSFDANGDIQTQYYDIWKFEALVFTRGHGYWQDPTVGVEGLIP